jgi:hypothetical protein
MADQDIAQDEVSGIYRRHARRAFFLALGFAALGIVLIVLGLLVFVRDIIVFAGASTMGLALVLYLLNRSLRRG